ncbi:two-component system sensor histidine kinase DctS [Anoxybacillus tepidamans]|uniref:histidine kinase n=1 Tax=Anoxybacteroides tepidamans TaxID=265948 RepID=A0A7W8ITB2_9BACL|nr:sensor histidine kinase [Anoxybacillus tepidamans]MBB5326313.1 two-component system sensor histidine kinase DctS [Anoxybacillus tepidamans]
MKRLSIRWKITALIFFIVGFSLLLGGTIVVGNFVHTKEEELKQRALLTARTVSELPEIKQKITGTKKERSTIDPIAERLRIIHGAAYITVLDMHKVRLSHPVKDMIGKRSKGKDEGPAFAEHTYTSKARGEIGTVIRAFVPVMNAQHEQVGVVIAAYQLPSFLQVLLSLKTEILVTTSLSLLFGGFGAWMLASHIKRQMFQLEPHEIAKLLVERTETFNAMHEGVIAIDTDERITIFNDKAKKMLGIHKDVVGQPIRSVLPDTHLPEILQINQPIYNKELQIRNLNILSNRIPIKVDGQTVGAVAIFQDQTEVKKLAEELTGVKAFVSALRVQNHEYMNKLHTIAGLIQLGHKEKALEYVFKVTEEQAELTRFLSKNIKDESISGLLLSKISRGKELGIQVTIDRHSQLKKFPPHLDHHDFVVVLGNLIENAFDSFQTVVDRNKEVYISIEQNDEILSLSVEDNGCGIDEQHKAHIFDEGFSTKGTNDRGIGLYLIKQIVDKGKGHIHVESEKEKGTIFTITFDM